MVLSRTEFKKSMQFVLRLADPSCCHGYTLRYRFILRDSRLGRGWAKVGVFCSAETEQTQVPADPKNRITSPVHMASPLAPSPANATEYFLRGLEATRVCVRPHQATGACDRLSHMRAGWGERLGSQWEENAWMKSQSLSAIKVPGQHPVLPSKARSHQFKSRLGDTKIFRVFLNTWSTTFGDLWPLVYF